MDMSLGGLWELWEMHPLIYQGTDPDMIAAVESFNAFFSITFEFGVMAFCYIMIITLIARS